MTSRISARAEKFGETTTRTTTQKTTTTNVSMDASRQVQREVLAAAKYPGGAKDAVGSAKFVGCGPPPEERVPSKKFGQKPTETNSNVGNSGEKGSGGKFVKGNLGGNKTVAMSVQNDKQPGLKGDASGASKGPKGVEVKSEAELENGGPMDGPLSPGRTKGLAGFWSAQNDEVKNVRKKKFVSDGTDQTSLDETTSPGLSVGVVRAEGAQRSTSIDIVEDGKAKNLATNFQKRSGPPVFPKKPIQLVDSDEGQDSKIKVKDLSERLVRQTSQPEQRKEKITIERAAGVVVLAENEPEAVSEDIVKNELQAKELDVFEAGRTKNLLQHWKNTEVEYNTPKTSTSRLAPKAKPAWVAEIEEAKGISLETPSTEDKAEEAAEPVHAEAPRQRGSKQSTTAPPQASKQPQDQQPFVDTVTPEKPSRDFPKPAERSINQAKHKVVENPQYTVEETSQHTVGKIPVENHFEPPPGEQKPAAVEDYHNPDPIDQTQKPAAVEHYHNPDPIDQTQKPTESCLESQLPEYIPGDNQAYNNSPFVAGTQHLQPDEQLITFSGDTGAHVPTDGDQYNQPFSKYSNDLASLEMAPTNSEFSVHDTAPAELPPSDDSAHQLDSTHDMLMDILKDLDNCEKYIQDDTDKLSNQNKFAAEHTEVQKDEFHDTKTVSSANERPGSDWFQDASDLQSPQTEISHITSENHGESRQWDSTSSEPYQSHTVHSDTTGPSFEAQGPPHYDDGPIYENPQLPLPPHQQEHNTFGGTASLSFQPAPESENFSGPNLADQPPSYISSELLRTPEAAPRRPQSELAPAPDRRSTISNTSKSPSEQGGKKKGKGDEKPAGCSLM